MAGERKSVPLPRPPAAVARAPEAVARAMARDAFGREIPDPAPQPAQPGATQGDGTAPPTKKEMATDALGRRAGALSDELDFPAFVASLVHGTFDAIVDSSIRQMESFADLVAAVAKPLDQFSQDNVSPNQVRDWLVQQYPKDLQLSPADDGPKVVPRPVKNEDGEEEPASPAWLADYGLGDQELTPELIEQELIPKARDRVAQNRLQTLATMVLLGMNRVIVKDGTVSARLRFRAQAADHSKVDYAVGDDPSANYEWGTRGNRTYDTPTTKVSTVGVNVQSDSDLKAELFGEVKINFASETLPLERFADDARRTLLERHARPRERATSARAAPAIEAVPQTALPAPAPTPAAAATPAPAGAPAGGARP